MSSINLSLYFIRHGETVANVNRNLYKTIADAAIDLTPKGIAQATECGEALTEYLLELKKQNPEEFGKIRVYFGPYHRTRQTARYILYPLGQAFDVAAGEITYREHLFLYEQKAGLFDGMSDKEFSELFPKEAADYHKHKSHNALSFATTPLGESRIETAERARSSFATVQKHLLRRNIRHAILVSHGVTTRAMTMAWMHYPPEWFDAEQNPGNCWVRRITGSSDKGYTDLGYIHGDGAPLSDPQATQRRLERPDKIYMLKPQHPHIIVPKGVRCIDPFSNPKFD